MSGLQVYSGTSCLCDVGHEVGANAEGGEALHTGDIVSIAHGNYLGEDFETWTVSSYLTVVVSNQYQSYTDGSKTENLNPMPFVMGIKQCGFTDPEWRITMVKKYFDVVDGEKWPAWGFSYKATGGQS